MKLLLPILLLSFSAYAQTQEAPLPAPGKKLKAELSLTDQQYRQLHNYFSDYRQQVKNVDEDRQLPDAQKQAKFKKLEDAYGGKVKHLLSTDQYTQYLQWNAKRQARLQKMQLLQDRQLPGRTSPGKS